MRKTLRILVFIVVLPILATLPGDISPTYLTFTGDIDGDGATEHYLLMGYRITVLEGNKLLWQSPLQWRVDEIALGDADNDGTVNLVISLWKRGSFSQIKPFWENGEDRSYKNHLFVFRLSGDTFRPVWCSSDLDRPILSFTIQDADNDGMNELVTKEGSYRRIAGEIYTADRKNLTRTIWRWCEWGFRLANN